MVVGDLRGRRQGPLGRHRVVRRRPHSPAGLDGAGEPHHGAAAERPRQRRLVHQRHAEDGQPRVRHLGRQHHQREHQREALHEHDLGQPPIPEDKPTNRRSSASSTVARNLLSAQGLVLGACRRGCPQWLLIVFAAVAAVSQPAPVQRTVYVTAAAADGSALAGLNAADVVVKEGGQDRQVLRVEPSRAKLQVAVAVEEILAPDSDVRRAVANFIDQIRTLGRYRPLSGRAAHREARRLHGRDSAVRQRHQPLSRASGRTRRSRAVSAGDRS